MELYNLDKCALSDRNGTYGGNSGDKEGILIGDEHWIIKYPKKAKKLQDVKDMSYTSSPVSEYIGSHVYEILGYPVHRTVLGIRNNHVVVACKDLCDDSHRLIEFRQLKNTYNKTLNEKLDMSMTSSGSEHFVNLEEIMIHLKYNPSLQNVRGLKERFWDCVVIDGLINNNDRNNGNWGILRGKDGDTISPVFDNGASFSPNVPEPKILNKLKSSEALEQGACGIITAYSIDGERNAMFREIIELDIPELKESVRRIIPVVKEHIPEINSMIDEIPESVGNFSVISADRKSVYKKEFLVRLENILEPSFERITRVEKKQNLEIRKAGKEDGYGYGR